MKKMVKAYTHLEEIRSDEKGQDISKKDKLHVIKYLIIGETYTLTEKFVPVWIFESITFTAAATSEIQRVEMKDDVPTVLLSVNKKERKMLMMKYVVGGLVIILIVIIVFLVYCCVVVGARGDRWLEEIKRNEENEKKHGDR